MFRLLFGIVLGVVVAPVALAAWLYFGKVPVAVGDEPFPYEHEVTHQILNMRMRGEIVDKPPVQVEEESLTNGAHIYREQCAACHGLHHKPSTFGEHMYPAAPQLWEKHGDVIGVSDDSAGETYWKVANGIRLTGMPAYKDVLTDTEMWDVSLLLANADKPLPPGALEQLKGASPAPAPEPKTEAKQ